MAPATRPSVWRHNILPGCTSLERNLSLQPLLIVSWGGRIIADSVDHIYAVDILDFFKVDVAVPVAIRVLHRSHKVSSVRVAEHEAAKRVFR